ncbi:MAG: PadR family transcriptional regulator [Pirellulales bacterium]|nr:PadR family transcriptional regulator [Pirellulales bacterium]
MKLESELLRGAGPTAVLKLLSSGEMYGYQIVQALAEQSAGVLNLGQSTLYPLLYNLEAKGYIKSRQDETGPRPRRYYRLTSQGQAKLAADARQWQALFRGFEALQILPVPGWKGA